MNPEEKIKELANGIGALVEVSYMFYSTASNKFTPEQALELTKSFIQTTLMLSSIKGDSGK